MTKTLTEQWREGTLPDGYYYIRWSFNIDDEPSYMIDFYDREDFVDGAFIYKQRKFIDEVMCVVPSYDEYRELLDLNVYEKDRKKVMGLEDKIKRLQEQINEANEVIKKYSQFNNWEGDDKDQHDMTHFIGEDNGCGWEIAQDYLEKWGVK